MSSTTDAKKKAEQYLRDQAEIIRKYGGVPKLRGEKYKEAVNDTTRTFKMLASARHTTK
jgi:hypothetical protein